MTNELCRLLEWDTEFFGRRIGRVVGARLTEEMASRALGWCEDCRIDCLYFLADPSDPVTAGVAEDNGFRLVDVRMTLGRRLRAKPAPAHGRGAVSVRSFAPDDLPTLRELARQNHTDSRFYFDGAFPPSRCDALYETWIAKSCDGYADAVLVAHGQERPAGYITCVVDDDGRGEIGLVGVAPEVRGQGVGTSLVEAAVEWFADNGVEHVRVVTQGRNVAAQRLYQKCGFLAESVELWFHRWFPRRELA